MKDFFNKYKGISIRNFFNLVLNQGINVLVALILTPYLFRTLGEEKYGLVSLALTVVLLFGMVVNYGFNLNIPKKLALIQNDLKAKEELINDVVSTRLIFSLALAFILFISINYAGLFPGYGAILLFSLVQLFNDAVYPLFILQGFDRLSWIAKANALAKITYLVSVILIVNSTAQAYWVNFLLGSTGLMVHFILIVLVYRVEGMTFRFAQISKVKFWIRENFQFFSSTVASYLSINGGFILLKSFVSESELGFFALAQRVAILLRMIPIFLAQSILQIATRLYTNNKNEFEQYLNRAYKNGVALTLVVAVFLAFSSSWVVRILAGEYIPLSANLMRILGFVPFIGMLNVKNVIHILIREQKRVLAKASWYTAIITCLFAALGSAYWGSYGLAFALLLTESFSFWIHKILLNKVLDDRPTML